MAPKKKARTRSRKAAKRSNRTGSKKTAKAAARVTATRKATTRKGARKAGSRKASARKPTAGKSAARKSTRKSATRKSATRTSITQRATRGVSTLRQSLVRSLPEEGVKAAVKEKARQGFELAREGLERVKDTTVGVTATVIEGIKERISRDDEDRPAEPEPVETRDTEPLR